MEQRNLNPDYFPVFKDLADKSSSPLQGKSEEWLQDPADPPGGQFLQPDIMTFRSMLNATEVIEKSSVKGFTVFQTVVLLVKNAFEGHVFMTRHLRPYQLSEMGTFLFQSNPDSLISGFYEHLDQYLGGLNQAWDQLKKRHTELDEIPFEPLVYSILISQLIRLPVICCASYDLMQFRNVTAGDIKALGQWFALMVLGEHALADFLFIERIDRIYKEKFSDNLKKIELKEGILSHYERKRVLSYNPKIKTEEELDVFMYECLVGTRVRNNHSQRLKQQEKEESASPGSASAKNWLNSRIRFLYRAISKNCHEVHNSASNEPPFYELNWIFMSANSIYNDSDFTFHEVLIKYMRLVLLFSEVTIYRESHGLEEVSSIHLGLDGGPRETSLTPGIVHDCHRNFDEKAATMRASSYTDFKMKNILADDMAEIHKICLEKQADYIDEQIRKIQQEIKEVMKIKSGERKSVS